jgi:hypothetical protein
MGLGAVFDAIAAEFEAEVRFVGPDRKDDNSSPGRISWDPRGAKHEPPQRTGGGAGDDGHILTRHWLVEVEIWGDGFDDTQDLANRFLAVLHDKVTKFSYRPGEEKWNTGGNTANGCTCTMMIVIITPIPRTAARTARPTLSVNFQMGDTTQVG